MNPEIERKSDTEPEIPPKDGQEIEREQAAGDASSGSRAETALGALSVSESQAVPQATVPPSIRLWHKHPLAIRWMHWLNFPLLAVMIWSGLMIYWADSDPDGSHSNQVYRIGLGHWTLFRFFPQGFYKAFHLTFGLANGMGYHYFFMWLFGINGVVYVLYTAISGEWRHLVPGPGALRNAWQVTLHDLRLRREKPSQGKYNGAQQMAYTAVVLMGLGSLLTGLAIYKPVQLHTLTSLLGGYESARFFHFWLTMFYVLFFVIHVLQVARAGWNNFRSMVAGYEVVPVAGEEPVEL